MQRLTFMEIVNAAKGIGEKFGLSVIVNAYGKCWEGQVCRCGCGKAIRPGSKYSKGHYSPNFNTKFSEEQKQIISERLQDWHRKHPEIRKRAGQTRAKHQVRLNAEYLKRMRAQDLHCQCGCGESLVPTLSWKHDGVPRFIKNHASWEGDANPAKRPEIREKIRMSKLGRTKENDAGRRAASEKRQGRTKETHKYLKKLSEDRTGSNRFNSNRVRKMVETKRGEGGWKPSEEFMSRVMITRCSNEKDKFTKPEMFVAEALKAKNIVFVHPYPIGRYHADFLIADDIVIEVDGWTHTTDRGKEIDKRKDVYLASKGYTVFRLREKDIYKDVDACVNTVIVHLVLAA